MLVGIGLNRTGIPMGRAVEPHFKRRTALWTVVLVVLHMGTSYSLSIPTNSEKDCQELRQQTKELYKMRVASVANLVTACVFDEMTYVPLQ